MESNGESNRIHVTEETAKLIENDGKGYVIFLFVFVVFILYYFPVLTTFNINFSLAISASFMYV
jgi:hypothetical protein